MHEFGAKLRDCSNCGVSDEINHNLQLGSLTKWCGISTTTLDASRLNVSYLRSLWGRSAFGAVFAGGY
jgi:hypothetical protein